MPQKPCSCISHLQHPTAAKKPNTNLDFTQLPPELRKSSANIQSFESILKGKVIKEFVPQAQKEQKAPSLLKLRMSRPRANHQLRCQHLSHLRWSQHHVIWCSSRVLQGSLSRSPMGSSRQIDLNHSLQGRRSYQIGTNKVSKEYLSIGFLQAQSTCLGKRCDGYLSRALLSRVIQCRGLSFLSRVIKSVFYVAPTT